MSYTAPIKDMQFVLNELAGLKQIQQLPGCEDATDETVQAVLEENARFMSEVVAPLNWSGDIAAGSDGRTATVTTSAGIQRGVSLVWRGGMAGNPASDRSTAVRVFRRSSCRVHGDDAGGQPVVRTVSVADRWCDRGAAGRRHRDEQKQAYLPRLIDGTWTGTMNLTEPQAGSDLAQVRTRAVPQADGTYRLFGQKIFITYGDHDLADNIVHLVLARTPEAPEGVKGISLFIVPEGMFDADGTLGKRNDVYCASIEHKLGIKASPTCVLIYGDDKGEGRARRDRLPDRRGESRPRVHVHHDERGALSGRHAGHRDVGPRLPKGGVVREGARAEPRDRGLERPGRDHPAPGCAPHVDVHARARPRRRGPSPTSRPATTTSRTIIRTPLPASEAQAAYEYLVPIVKGWSTEMSIDVASTGVQVHGGMGFIEETGAAQYYRDARILTIYEGTTAIQANDLVGRKTSRDGGATARRFIGQMRETAAELQSAPCGDLAAIGKRLATAVDAYETVDDYVVDRIQERYPRRVRRLGPLPEARGHRARRLADGTCGAGAHSGWSTLDSESRLRAKIATARFFADHMPHVGLGHRRQCRRRQRRNPCACRSRAVLTLRLGFNTVGVPRASIVRAYGAHWDNLFVPGDSSA